MRLASDYKAVRVRSAFAAAIALLSVVVTPALAAVEVRGQQGDLQVEAKNASLREILDALSAKFALTYKIPPTLRRVVTGRYSGTLQQVLRRVLDGSDFIVKASDDRIEVVVLGVSQATAVAAIEQAPPPRPAPVAANGFPSKPPPLNSYLSGNGPVANASASGSP